MRKQYKFVKHTADVEYVASGRSLEECFKNALMAMFDTLSYVDKVSLSKSKIITLKIDDKASTLQDLLWYVLQDILSVSDSKSVFCYGTKKITIRKTTGSYRVNATFKAKEREDKTSKLDVKGVARYNLTLKKTKDRFEATVVLDV